MQSLTCSWYRKFLTAETGGVMIEFAFILPIMLMLTFPVVDYSRYILLQQKLVKAASFMSDAASYSTPVDSTTTQQQIDQEGKYLTEASLRGIVNTINIHMMPFNPAQNAADNRYQAILTHVYRDAASGAPVMGWQYDENSQSFAGNRSESTIGQITSAADIGSPATMPPELQTLEQGENLVVAEVFADYQPITPDLSTLGVRFLSAQRLSYRAFFRARNGNLRCIWQVYMPPNC